MTVLPIADRELRVSARSKVTHRLRILFAVAAAIVAGAIGLISLASRGALSSQLGYLIFQVIKWGGFVFACGSGVFLTADCLSEEKREGTLGLLFLTDLRGHDVVLGKLFATSLRSFYSLLAVFPIMAFSFCLGGVSGGDFWLSLVAICNALFFSLALGLLISVLSRDANRAMTATLVALVMVLFVPLALDDSIFGGTARHAWLGLLSPAYASVNTIGSGKGDFWPSVLAVHLLGWCWLATASWLVPKTWHEKRGIRVAGLGWEWRRFNASRSASSGAAMRDQDPIRWIISRDRWASNMARLSIVLIVATFVLSFVASIFSTISVAPPTTTFTTQSTNGVTTSHLEVSAVAWAGGASQTVFYEIATTCAGFLSLALEFWLMAQVSRFYVDGKRSGFLELLLVTPVRPADIVRGHWVALRSLFRAPVIALIALNLAAAAVQMLATHTVATAPGSSVTGSGTPVFQVALLVLSQLGWFTGLFALAWYSIWMGVVSKRIPVAMLKTFCCVKILPWFVVSFVIGLSAFAVVPLFGSAGIWVISATPQALIICANLILMSIAKRHVGEAFARVSVA